MSLPLIFWLEDCAVLLHARDITASHIPKSRPERLCPPLIPRQERILLWNSVDAVGSMPNTFENLILVRASSVSLYYKGENIEVWGLVLHLPHLNGSYTNYTLASQHAGLSTDKNATGSRGCVGNERGWTWKEVVRLQCNPFTSFSDPYKEAMMPVRTED